MKLIALIRKEIREILPWVLLGAIAFGSFGALLLKMESTNSRYQWCFQQIKSGQFVEDHSLFINSVLTGNGAWLFVVSLILGAVLAIRQFWMPFFTRTWQFELHRSVSRSTILFAKMFAAIMYLSLSLGGLWVGMYLYACRPGVFVVPPSLRNFLEGWVFIGMGLLVYFAISLAALTRARWYTTKIFGPFFAFFIIMMMMSQISIYWSFGTFVAGMILLFSQVAYTF